MQKKKLYFSLSAMKESDVLNFYQDSIEVNAMSNKSRLKILREAPRRMQLSFSVHYSLLGLP